MAEVILEKIEKIYPNGVQALFPMDLHIQAGELVVLVGPSGCGKSTLLRTIAGLEDLTCGVIHIGGLNMTHVSPGRRDVAMVFQDYALYPHMTVSENLAFGLKMRKTPQIEIGERIRSVSTLLNIENLLDRRPAKLSGGQRQRVAIGRAIARRPQVYLFDEPLSNLDAQLRAQTRVEIASLQKKLGTTSVYVTHDQVEAMSLADRIVVLEAGRIQQVAAPMELYRNPSNQFVASFMGSPGMNFVSGSVLQEGGKFYFVSVDGRLEISEVPLTLKSAGTCVLGIRPECLEMQSESSETDRLGLRARVILVERLGHEIQVVFQLTTGQLIARCPMVSHGAMKAETFKGGQRVSLGGKSADLFWFTHEGQRLR